MFMNINSYHGVLNLEFNIFWLIIIVFECLLRLASCILIVFVSPSYFPFFIFFYIKIVVQKNTHNLANNLCNFVCLTHYLFFILFHFHKEWKIKKRTRWFSLFLLLFLMYVAYIAGFVGKCMTKFIHNCHLSGISSHKYVHLKMQAVWRTMLMELFPWLKKFLKNIW